MKQENCKIEKNYCIRHYAKQKIKKISLDLNTAGWNIWAASVLPYACETTVNQNKVKWTRKVVKSLCTPNTIVLKKQMSSNENTTR